ncbi:hypothetical protein POPA111323_07555 [Polynucleobacter paneuropaeus]
MLAIGLDILGPGSIPPRATKNHQNDCLGSHFSFLVLVFTVTHSIQRCWTLPTAVYFP